MRFDRCAVNSCVCRAPTSVRRGDAQKARAVAKTNVSTNYEGVLLLRPDCDDATRAGAVEGFKAMFDGGLESWEQTDRGLVPNSYEIKGYPDAYQVMVNFTCKPAAYKTAAEALATPAVGSEEVIIRTMFLKSA